MIAFLSGVVEYKNKNSIILRTGDIGYRVFIGVPMLAEVGVSENISLFIHQHIREDATELYGFKLPQELELFELLISISGVGPKSGLGILAIASPDEIQISISQGDVGLLTKVSGIGKKIADRIILELRGKMAVLAPSVNDNQPGMLSEEIDALQALGYSLQESRDALHQVDPLTRGSGERIREALKKLAK